MRERDITILLIGASRGLGVAMAAEFLTKGWDVVGTVQESARTELHDLADKHPGRVEIETLDVTEPYASGLNRVCKLRRL